MARSWPSHTLPRLRPRGRNTPVDFKLLEYNHDASLYGNVLLPYRYKLYPSGDQYDSTLFVRETLANGQVNPLPGEDAHGVRLALEEPPQ